MERAMVALLGYAPGFKNIHYLWRAAFFNEEGSLMLMLVERLLKATKFPQFRVVTIHEDVKRVRKHLRRGLVKKKQNGKATWGA